MEIGRPEKKNVEVSNVGSMGLVFLEVQKHDLKLALEKKAIKQAGLGEEEQLQQAGFGVEGLVQRAGLEKDKKLSKKEGIKDDMMLQQTGLAEEKVSRKTFEEVTGELDEEINKYDSKDSMAISLGVNMEKENMGGQHTINEASMPCPPSHVTNVSSAPRVPSAELPCSLVKHEYTEGVRKRIKRVEVTEDIGMYEAVGGKRSGDREASQTELPKQIRVSQGGATKNKILAKAGNQPCQKQ